MDKITYDCYFAYYQDNTDASKPLVAVYGFEVAGSMDQKAKTFNREETNSYGAWLDCMHDLLKSLFAHIEAGHKHKEVTINFVIHAKLTNVQYASLKMLLAVFEQYKKFNYHDMTIQAINRAIRTKSGKASSDPSFKPKCQIVHALLQLHHNLSTAPTIKMTVLNTATKNQYSQTFNALFQMAQAQTELV